INFEGGAIPEEYLTAYIVDRVNTTSTVFLGLTVACAQCHDHKYDPISQKEFYQLYAFFNNVPENGLDGAKGNAAPLLKMPTRQQEETLRQLEAAQAKLEQELNGASRESDDAQAEWERGLQGGAAPKGKLPKAVAAALMVEPAKRSQDQIDTLKNYYRRSVSPALKAQADQLSK